MNWVKTYFVFLFQITDLNDHAPEFSESILNLMVPETAGVGVTWALPRPTDPDAAQNGLQRYEMLERGGPFKLLVSNRTSGGVELRLGLTSSLDREATETYSLHIIAYDGGVPERSGTLSVNVVVSDSNDNSPVFTQPSYRTDVPEDTPSGRVLTQVTAIDADDGDSGRVFYELSQQSQQWGQLFEVDRDTGEVKLIGDLDHEEREKYQLVINALDMGTDPIPSSTEVIINVEDINDNTPLVTVEGVSASGGIEVLENMIPDAVVAHIFVVDSDSGDNGDVLCELEDGEQQQFYLNNVYDNMFQLLTRVSLDREEKALYDLIVVCSDHGATVLSQRKEFQVVVTDQNDNPPVFNQYSHTASVQEGNQEGVPLFSLNATDVDLGESGRVSYYLLEDSTFLDVEPNSGLITTSGEFDFETKKEHRVRVVARDHGEPRKSSYADVLIHVININDEPPMFLQTSYFFSIPEDSASGSYVGRVDSISIDTAASNVTSYFIDSSSDNAELFQIHPTSGEIRTLGHLDREERSDHSIFILAVNDEPSGPSSRVQVHIHVTDVNDNSPVISFPSHRNNTIQLSTALKKNDVCMIVDASDADVKDNGRLHYSMDLQENEGLFYIEPESGVLRAEKDLSRAKQTTYSLLIYVSDQGRPALTSAVQVSVELHLGDDTGNTDSPTSGKGGLEQNEVVVIVIAIVTAIIVTLLVVAIVVVRRSNAQRKRMLSNKLKHQLMTSDQDTEAGDSTVDIKDIGFNEDRMAAVTDSSKLQYTLLNVSKSNTLYTLIWS